MDYIIFSMSREFEFFGLTTWFLFYKAFYSWERNSLEAEHLTADQKLQVKIPICELLWMKA